jgi:CRISPR-associated protein Cmr1
MQIKIKTLTPLWTGNVDGECKTIKETGIIGSLRWWYEALVRGLGGYACDPTSSEKCELNHKKFDNAIKNGKSVQEALDEQICPVCQLFGCTGWSRKFKIEILTNEIYKCSPSYGFEGVLKISLRGYKPIQEDEKWLLKKTLDIIGKYGSIGGRTTRKPQKSIVGMDYGLIAIENMKIETNATKEGVKSWILDNKKAFGDNNEKWPDLKYFFFVNGKFLSRNEMNMIMNNIPFLKGKRKDGKFIGKSKKIFSFKSNGGRIWGYCKNDILEDIEKKFNQMGITQVIWGKDVLK